MAMPPLLSRLVRRARPLVLAVALLGFGWLTAQALEDANLRNYQVETLERDRQTFKFEFDRPPFSTRAYDLLVNKKLFYIDLYGVSGPAEPAEWNYDSLLVHRVQRRYFPGQKVLRYIFHTAQKVQFQQKPMGRQLIVSVVPLGAMRPSEAKPAKLIVIDPGHGGWANATYRYEGAQTSRAIGGKHYHEKDLVLQIAQRLDRLIRQTTNLKSHLTRTGDYYLSLDDRITQSNRVQGDLFLSIHLNGSDSRRKTARGFEVFYLSETSSATNRLLEAMENEEQLPNQPLTGTGGETTRELLRSLADDQLVERRSQSIELATMIDNEFRDKGPFRAYHRGVKSARFRVLMNYVMPSVLVECGFLDNPDEAKQLIDAKVQEQIARLLFNGINRYFAKVDPEFVPQEPARTR